MPSKAFSAFKDNLQQVNRLLATYDSELNKNHGKGKRGLDHLTRAGLIFLCSAFEVYVESVTRESGKIITDRINVPSKFPLSVQKKIANAVKQEKNELSPILYYDDWKKYYNELILYDTRHLNTPKLNNVMTLFGNYFGIEKSAFDIDNFPLTGVDDIVSIRGDVAHNIFTTSYLKRAKLIEYYDTIKEAAMYLDKMLYDELPKIIERKPWNKTY